MADFTDRELLKRFEPVMRFNRGERFFPMRVDEYVGECSLWLDCKGQSTRRLVPEGDLTLDRLAEPVSGGFGAVHYLQFIEPLNLADLARWQFQEGWDRRKKDPRDIFMPGRGRLTRVGYSSRFLDALFSLSLLARGRVPGDTAAAAALTYSRIMKAGEHYQYYGRVLRENGWIVLQYFFFYPYNNWRSGFFGVNDHEADWEQVCLYLYEAEDGDVRPEWVAYAAHDYEGDNLRRRWDDPELQTVGEHPVIYVGAGSHASYFAQGDYLTEVDVPFLRPLTRVVDRFQRIRREALAEYQGVQISQQVGHEHDVNMFYIPFVDYARGDGWGIGQDEDRGWDDPILLDPTPDWAFHYRGLWGLYARDPLSGEDAPAGPLYNRDGSVRRAWYDPLGWVGLDKVPPPEQTLPQVYERRAAILNRRDDLEAEIAEMSAEIASLGLDLAAMRGVPHLEKQSGAGQARLEELVLRVKETRVKLTEDAALLSALAHYADRQTAGERGDPRAHVTLAHTPMPPTEKRTGRVAEFWSAVSVGLLLVSFVVLAVFRPQNLWIGLGLLIGTFMVIEYGFRRRLGQLITAVTLIMAVVAAGILLVEFFVPILVAVVLLVGGYVMWENLLELRRK